MSTYAFGAVPPDLAEEMLTPADKPEAREAGLPLPRTYGVMTPSELEHRTSVRDAAARFTKYEQMRRTSSAVRVGERALRIACRQAVPFISQSDDVDPASAEGLAEQFGIGDYERTGRLKQSLRDIIALALPAITDGAVFLAPEWEFADGRWWITRLHKRHVQTFTDIWEDERGRMVGFRQRVDGRAAEVPLHACLYIVDDEGAGHFGLGINRTVMPVWEDEQDCLKKQRGAVSRFAFGTPVTGIKDLESYHALRADALNAGKSADGWLAEHDTAQINSVRGLVALNRGYIKREWWQDIQILEANFEPSKLDQTILARQVEIARLYNAGFIYQGSPGMGGTFNMVSVMAGTLLDFADEALDTIYSALNAQLCEWWHHYNMPEVPPEKRAALGYKLPRPRDPQEVDDYIKLVQARVLTPGPEDERYHRQANDWPDMPEEAEAMGPVERGAALRRAATAQADVRADARASAVDALRRGRDAARQGGQQQPTEEGT